MTFVGIPLKIHFPGNSEIERKRHGAAGTGTSSPGNGGGGKHPCKPCQLDWEMCVMLCMDKNVIDCPDRTLLHLSLSLTPPTRCDSHPRLKSAALNLIRHIRPQDALRLLDITIFGFWVKAHRSTPSAPLILPSFVTPETQLSLHLHLRRGNIVAGCRVRTLGLRGRYGEVCARGNVGRQAAKLCSLASMVKPDARSDRADTVQREKDMERDCICDPGWWRLSAAGESDTGSGAQGIRVDESSA
ncbi:hypothetical protein DFH06DRAFT_1341840 [Mycena polygramma]|nr:hypothetical protein DFH06DRAFT_1341840 [Mycena polygramma]